MVYSDQGFHYQHAFRNTVLAKAGVTPSVSRKGSCLDNAMIENFFGHLKEELVHQTTYTEINTLVAAIHEYMAWYSTERISTTLNGVDPVQYRIHAVAA